MADMLPEGCIAQVLSMTSPEDACRLSLVGTMFHSAADSDAVWDKFLPADYKEIIARAITLSKDSTRKTSSDSPLAFKSKKELYFLLADHPLVIDQGTKSFSLEKRTGKRCYMLAARDLNIVWGDTPRYWRWNSSPDSRFREEAELLSVCWLEIRGTMDTSLLSPNTAYTAYLVFKTKEESFGFEYKPVEVSVGTKGDKPKTRSVYLDPNRGERRQGHYPIILRQRRPSLRRGGLFSRRRVPMRVPRAFQEVEEEEEEEEVVVEREKVEVEKESHPKERADGWMEIELGDYFSGEEGDGNKELEMSLMEVRGGDWKSGLVVQGIDIRPKLADK